MHIPQISGALRVWLTVIGTAIGFALAEYAASGHAMNGWSDLWAALPQITWDAAKALFYTLVVASPYSKQAMQQRAILKQVEVVGVKATDAAKATVEAMQEASTQAVVEQLKTVEPPGSGTAVAAVIPPKDAA